MLLSKRKQFIFIHVPKVAGRSIQESFGKYADWPLDNSMFTRAVSEFSKKLLTTNVIAGLLPGADVPVPRYVYRDHVRAYELRDYLGESYNSFFSFAFVRNPWDWNVSQYHYILNTPGNAAYRTVKNMSFEEYLEWWGFARTYQLSQFVRDRTGQIIVDFVGRFETFEADLDYVCHRLGIVVSIPHLNRTSHRDYRTYYNHKSIKRVAEIHSDDIYLFGYSFEGFDGEDTQKE